MQRIYHAPVSEPDPYFATLAEKARAEGFECVVDAVVIRHDRRVLVLKRAKTKSLFPGCWDLPGGHVQNGESLEAALRRELTEEIGARVRSIDALVAIWNWEEPAKRSMAAKRMRQFNFVVTLETPQLRLDRHDFSEFRWITKDELPLLMENRKADDTHMLTVVRHALQVKFQEL